MNINDYLQLMSDRYSVRKFSDEPVAQEQIDTILKAAQLSPTACNAQSFRLNAAGVMRVVEPTLS